MNQPIAPTNCRIHNPLYHEFRNYYKHVKAPDSYIDAAFYFLMNACLQRRVWVGDCDSPLFPNLYIHLVGEPGLGKGITIKPILNMLRFHKLNRLKTGMEENFPGFQAFIQNGQLDEAARKNIMEAQEQIEQRNAEQKKLQDEPLLYPLSPESITYEALTKCMAQNIRKIGPLGLDKLCRLVPPTKIYTHNSLIICLEELSSLFKKKAEKIIDFLLVTFDCGQYTNETKTQGTDIIKRTCLSLLAGTTPSFLQESFAEKLLNEGYASRTLFIFEERNRFNQFGIPVKDLDQLESYLRILGHIYKLNELFGEIKYHPDAFAFMKEYFEVKNPRVNKSVKLNPYYARKDIMAVKFAIAIHMSRVFHIPSLPLYELQLEECQEAVRFLECCEPKMHFALQSGGGNVLSAAMRKIEKVLKHSQRPLNSYEIWLELENTISHAQVEETVLNMRMAGIVEVVSATNPQTYTVPKPQEPLKQN